MKGPIGKLIVIAVLSFPILLSACGKKDEPTSSSSSMNGAGPRTDSDRGSAGRTRGEGGGGK